MNKQRSKLEKDKITYDELYNEIKDQEHATYCLRNAKKINWTQY